MSALQNSVPQMAWSFHPATPSQSKDLAVLFSKLRPFAVQPKVETQVLDSCRICLVVFMSSTDIFISDIAICRRVLARVRGRRRTARAGTGGVGAAARARRRRGGAGAVVPRPRDQVPLHEPQCLPRRDEPGQHLAPQPQHARGEFVPQSSALRRFCLTCCVL